MPPHIVREWGTPLWEILHSMAENIGNQKSPLLAVDEANEIVFVLRFVEDIMPCALCRNHYRVWRQRFPLERLAKLRGEELRNEVRLWLYNLHENVNKDREVISNIVVEDLVTRYKGVDVGSQWDLYLQKIRTSKEMGLIKPGALQNFNRHLVILRKLTGKL